MKRSPSVIDSFDSFGAERAAQTWGAIVPSDLEIRLTRNRAIHGASPFPAAFVNPSASFRPNQGG